MNEYRPADERFWHLADESCNGPLADDQLRELEVYLNDPNLRHRYLEHCRLHCELFLSIRGQQTVDDLANTLRDGMEMGSLVGSLPAVQSWDNATSSNSVSAFDRRLLQPASSNASVGRGPIAGLACRRGNILQRSLCLAAASLTIVGVFWTFWAYLIYSGRSDYLNRPTEGAMAAVATLTVERECVWQTDSRVRRPHVGQRLGVDDVILLHSGVAELTFASGAHVAVEGPCHFELQTTGKGYLRSGKLAAHVPPRAAGFEVKTPTARVVDLGTDFRLEASSKETTLAVIAGKVDLFPVSSAAGGRKSTSDPPRRVTAGQAVTIAAKANRTPIVQEVRFDAEWLSMVARALPRPGPPSPIVAYQIPENAAGNRRDFHGGVGLDFEVRVPIRVFSLGVFDHLGDGIDSATSPTVQLWSRDVKSTPQDTRDDVGHEVLASQVFEADDSGELKLGHRFKPLPKAIDLPVGAYSIVTYGLSDANPFIKFEEKHDVDFHTDPGWTGVNHTQGGNHFGWSAATNHTGEQAGEVGGVFARAQIDSFYGDTHLLNTLDLNQNINASGKFDISREWVESIGSGGFFIGHFSTAANDSTFLGLEFENAGGDDAGTKLVEVRARVCLPKGGKGASSDRAYISANGNHTFRYTYDPNLGENGRLTLNIDDQPALVTNLTDGERNSGAQFNAFGIGATRDLSSDSDPTKTVQVFIDDVSYSGCQATPGKAADSEESMVRLQMETSRGAIMPMGSRWADAQPGTFPRMLFGKKLSGIAAGSFEYGLKTEGSRQRAEGSE
jgi:hypothetical protein